MTTAGMAIRRTGKRMDDNPPNLRGEEPQPLVGFRTNAEWEELLAETGDRLAALDEIAPDARDEVFSALAGIDAIHREAMHRLVRLFKEGVLEQVVTDPAIGTLMGMYDLTPPETPGCKKVWDFLPDDAADVDGLSADPIGTPPHWSPAPLSGPLADGEHVLCRMEEGTLIFARADEKSFAFTSQCPEHGSMRGGVLSGFTWACPSGPGCLYDIRNGARMGGGEPLECHTLREESSRLMVGFGVPFTPKLPAS